MIYPTCWRQRQSNKINGHCEFTIGSLSDAIAIMFAKVYLWICAAMFLVLAIALVGWPAEILAGVDLKFDTPTALSDIRADYGGCILGIGVFLAWCAMDSGRVNIGLLCTGLILTGYASGRLLSLIVDGTPRQIIFVLMAAEIVGASVCFTFLYLGRRPSLESQ